MIDASLDLRELRREVRRYNRVIPKVATSMSNAALADIAYASARLTDGTSNEEILAELNQSRGEVFLSGQKRAVQFKHTLAMGYLKKIGIKLTWDKVRRYADRIERSRSRSGYFLADGFIYPGQVLETRGGVFRALVRKHAAETRSGATTRGGERYSRAHPSSGVREARFENLAPSTKAAQRSPYVEDYVRRGNESVRKASANTLRKFGRSVFRIIERALSR